jgi:hypothetical protein
MNLFKDLRNITVLVLLGLVIVSQFKGCTPDWPWNDNPSDTVSVKVDTVYKEVKEEVPVYIPKWRTRVETETDTVEKLVNVDTTAILKDYYSKYQYIDTVKLTYTDTLGVKKKFGHGIITDIVSQNQIIQRGIVWDYKIPYITKTITLQAPPRRQLYIGAGVAFNKVNFVDNVSGGIIYKTKKDKIYQLSVGMANQDGAAAPFLGGGIYWKIKLKN